MTKKKETTEVKVVKIKDIKSNPNNPRVIKDAKFKKLVKSLQDFPDMLNARPIIVNQDMVIIGGNMRYKAAKELGYTEVPIIKVDWTKEQEDEFVIKDNLSSGEFDWDDLANNWDDNLLSEWGVIKWEVPQYNPTLIPETNHSDVTQAEINNKAEEIANRFLQESKTANIICPSCGNEFEIKI